jgi:nitrate reductase (NAD(P)H)
MLFSAKTKLDGKLCMRAYTPVSADCDIGYFELVVKAYFPQLPAFPEGGKMSQHLCGMQVGDWIDVRGPLGHVTYHGQGMVSFGKHRRLVRGFAMLAAGTGITPIYQVLAAVVREQQNKTQAANALHQVVCHVIYANRTEEDILLKRELDAFAAENPSTLRLHYVLSRPKDADAWCKGGGLTGRVSQQMISDLLPKGGFAEAGVMALLCGPDGFQKATCTPALVAHGYAEDDLIYF